MKTTLLFVIANIRSYTYSRNVQCPVINCDTSISDFMCFEHSGSTPVEEIRTFLCPYDQACNLIKGEFAWVTTSRNKQNQEFTSVNREDSQIYKKYTDKSCESLEDMISNNNNGRQCGSDYECLTGDCSNEKCVGLNETDSCREDYQCNVGLACITSKDWPYGSFCEKLRKVDEECLSDEQCQLDNYCWYKDSADAKAGQKKCMQMYVADDFTVYGYKEEPIKIDYNMQENYKYGRYCKSGIGVINKKKSEMTCVRIDQVETNMDPGIEYTNADKCKIVEDDGDAAKACNYQYKDQSGKLQTINFEYCECSLMKEYDYDEEGNIVPPGDNLPWLKGGIKPIPSEQIELSHGFCPFPRQEWIDHYIKHFKIINQKSKTILHTNDRTNLKAIGIELVHKELEPDMESYLIKNDTWAAVVNTTFTIDFWPFIQSNQTHTCVNEVMENSPRNMFKLGSKVLSSSFVGFAIAGFIYF